MSAAPSTLVIPQYYARSRAVTATWLSPWVLHMAANRNNRCLAATHRRASRERNESKAEFSGVGGTGTAIKH
ncbi:hypothetical protein D3C86_621790 [compost metagenome]